MFTSARLPVLLVSIFLLFASEFAFPTEESSGSKLTQVEAQALANNFLSSEEGAQLFAETERRYSISPNGRKEFGAYYLAKSKFLPDSGHWFFQYRCKTQVPECYFFIEMTDNASPKFKMEPGM